MNIETIERLAKVHASLTQNLVDTYRAMREASGYIDTKATGDAIKAVAEAVKDAATLPPKNPPMVVPA